MLCIIVLQELLDFVSTAVSPKMQVLECMYIRQTTDLLQVGNTDSNKYFREVRLLKT